MGGRSHPSARNLGGSLQHVTIEKREEKVEVIRGFLNCLVEFLNNLIRLLRSESPPFFILALIARAASTKGVKKE